MRDGETDSLNELIREINEARAKKGYAPFEYAERDKPTDYTEWSTARWFKKNFKVAKDIDTSYTGFAGDSENPEWIYGKKGVRVPKNNI
jgi:hypothetical protein